MNSTCRSCDEPKSWRPNSRRRFLAHSNESEGGCAAGRTVLLGLFLAGCTFLSAAHTEAQDGSQWFPDVEPFKTLIATPREIQVRASFVAAERPEIVGYGGRNIEAEVAVGHRLELIRLDDGSVPNQVITLGIEMGIHSRFFMETAQKDLINSDFRVGLPISIRSGPWESRISLRHVSSHLGDDYLVRFFESETAGGFGQTSKDGFEGILARRLGSDVRLYVGGDLNFHTNEMMSGAGARFGGEWEPVAPGSGDGQWPFFASDVEYGNFSKQLGATFVGGMGFRVNGQRFRLQARAHVGSTPVGHFRETDETFYGLGFELDL